MFLITGSTGELGTSVINALLSKIEPDKIAAMVRDKDKAEHWNEVGIDVRQGDYFYPDALKLLMVGIDKLLLISAPSGELRTTQHINVINVARQMGVKHIYYTSIQRKNVSDIEITGLTQSDKETENYLTSSGIDYTIVRNTLFADLIPIFVGENLTKTGVEFPAGKGKVPFVSRKDIGEAIANLLTQDGHENKEYNFTNNESWSFEDVADFLSHIKEKSISYTSAKQNAYIKKAVTNGLSQSDAELAADFAEAIAAGEFEDIDPFLETILGRKPTNLKQFLETIY